MKNIFLFLFLLISCTNKRIDDKIMSDTITYIDVVDTDIDTIIYQKIKIYKVKEIKKHIKRHTKVSFDIYVTISKNDTNVVNSKHIFYKGEWWAETVIKDGKIKTILYVDENETIKVKDLIYN